LDTITSFQKGSQWQQQKHSRKALHLWQCVIQNCNKDKTALHKAVMNAHKEVKLKHAFSVAHWRASAARMMEEAVRSQMATTEHQHSSVLAAHRKWRRGYLNKICVREQVAAEARHRSNLVNGLWYRPKTCVGLVVAEAPDDIAEVSDATQHRLSIRWLPATLGKELVDALEVDIGAAAENRIHDSQVLAIPPKKSPRQHISSRPELPVSNPFLDMGRSVSETTTIRSEQQAALPSMYSPIKWQSTSAYPISRSSLRSTPGRTIK